MAICVRLAIVLVLCSFAVYCSATSTPAFSLSVGTNAINYFKDIAIPLLIPKLQNLAFPDITGSVSVPVVGSVNYALTNLMLHSVSLGASTVNMIPPAAISSSMTQINLNITGDFKWAQQNFPHANGDGSVLVAVVGATASLQMSSVLSGAIQLHVDSCSVNIQQLDITVDGTILDSILNFLISAFKDHVKTAVSNAVPAAVSSAVQTQLNPMLAHLSTKFALMPNIELDYTWTSAPAVSASSVRVTAAVDAIFTQSPAKRCPSAHHPLPIKASNRMAQVVIDDYVLNSAAWAANLAGYTSILITNSMLGPNAKYHLNTVDFLPVMPSFFLRYPNKEMQIGLNGFSVVSAISPSGVAFVANGVSDIFVMMNSSVGGRFRAFSVFVNATGAMQLTLSSTTVIPQLTSLHCDIALKESFIGSISVSFFDTVMGWLCPGIIKNKANEFLSTGFPLPSLHGMQLVKPALSLGNGYAVFDTDLFWSPQEE